MSVYIHNWKSYFDSFKTFEVIDAESLIVIFFGTYGSLVWTKDGWVYEKGTRRNFSYSSWLDTKKQTNKKQIKIVFRNDYLDKHRVSYLFYIIDDSYLEVNLSKWNKKT